MWFHGNLWLGPQSSDPAHSSDSSPSREGSQNSDGSSNEEEEGEEAYTLSQGTVAFNTALEEVKAVVGADAPEELLKDLLLAADCDANRAVNFYFGTQ